MDEEEIKQFAEKLPRFEDGRIDFSNSEIAPVITIILKYKDKILLLKRSSKVSTYQRKWDFISGYLDDLKPLQEKVLEEIKEEVGIDKSHIAAISSGEPYQFTDKKTWIVHPILVELKDKPEIKLNWENSEYKWVKELKNFDTVPRLEESLKRALRK